MNDIKEHINISISQIRKKPFLFTLCILAATLLTISAANLHTAYYTIGTRILVEDTSRYSSILSGYYTPRSNIKETIENLKEAALSKDFIDQSIQDSKIDTNWDTNKPKLFHVTSKIAEILGKTPHDLEKNDRLVSFIRKKISFYSENNTIVLHFSWHNKIEAKLFIESIQRQIIDKNRSDQQEKSKKTIEILTSLKNDIDKSIGKISSNISKVDAQKKYEISKFDSSSLKRLQRKKERLVSIEEKISVYERKNDELAIDAEQTISKLRQTLGPKHPDLKLAIQASENKINRTNFLNELLQDRESIINEITSMESGLQLKQFIAANSDNNSPEIEAYLNEIRLLSVRRQEIEERIDDAKKSLLSTDRLLANTLTITDPPITPKKPSSRSTPEITVLTFLSSIFICFLLTYFQGISSDVILSDLLVEKRHNIRRL